jgi:ABC-type amino acid transport substrate-binding protein
MNKLALATALALAAFSAPALAASWNVTEESASGIKSAQGSWLLKTEGDAFTGTATLQRDNGTEVSYTVEGALKDGIYTVKLDKRSDDKKGCVWTGHAQAATALGKTTGFIGDVVCEGSKFVIRAQGQ